MKIDNFYNGLKFEGGRYVLYGDLVCDEDIEVDLDACMLQEDNHVF